MREHDGAGEMAWLGLPPDTLPPDGATTAPGTRGPDAMVRGDKCCPGGVA